MSTAIGILAAFLLIFVAIFLGGGGEAFLNVQGMLIVVFGTAAVTASSFSWSETISVPRNIWSVLRQGQVNADEEALKVLKFAVEVRKQADIMKVERLLPRIKESPFFERGIRMVLDGSTAEDIEQHLTRDANTLAARHMRAVDFLRRAGDVAPAMGLIGTLIGLVKMLGNLDDPSAIGPAMAIALLTTFYGAILAHLVFIPLAVKAEHSTSEESLVNQLYMMAATSIRRQENPRKLELLLNTILPPAQRIKYFR